MTGGIADVEHRRRSEEELRCRDLAVGVAAGEAGTVHGIQPSPEEVERAALFSCPCAK